MKVKGLALRGALNGIQFLSKLNILSTCREYSSSVLGRHIHLRPGLIRSSIDKSIFCALSKKNYKPLRKSNFWSGIHLDHVCISDSETENCLHSHLPYYTDSQLLIFANNFFPVNYSLRQPILVQYSVIDAFGKVLFCDSSTIAPYSQKILKIPAHIDGSEASDCFAYIQCFSLRLNPNHGANDGYYRVHGFYPKGKGASSSYSIVHSMPYTRHQAMINIVQHNVFYKSTRGVLPSSFSGSASISTYQIRDSHSYPSGRQVLEKDADSYVFKSKTKLMGFFAARNKDFKGISGIWHDGPVHYIKERSNDSNAQRVNRLTGFYVPSLKQNAPFMVIDNQTLGFNGPCNLSICISMQSREIKIPITYNGGVMIIDSQKYVRTDQYDEPASVYISFLGIKPSQSERLVVNFILRDSGKLIGDSSHSVHGFSSVRPPGEHPGGMVIWSPYVKSANSSPLTWHFCLHNLFAPEDTPSGNIKIRICTDRGFEFVHNIHSLPPGKNFLITDKELDSLTGFASCLDETAVIQFESRKSCIQGSFFVVSETGCTVGVDHLTGG